MEEFDSIICHCVSQDCSNCPMRNTGTSGVKAEWNFFHRNNNNNNNKGTENEIESYCHIPFGN